MLPVRRWLEPALAQVGGDGTGQSVHSALRDTLERQKSRAISTRVVDRATVVLDDGTGSPWTVRFAGGAFAMEPGRARDADTTISGDPLTLVSVVRGHRGGLDAFLRGRLRVRGNLALAIALDGVFDRRTRPSERPRAARLNAGGIDTFYVEAGTGPTVVVLHGLGATNASMMPTVAELSRTHRVLAPDLPGFGESEKPVATYAPAFFARWLSAFLDATGTPRASIIGNSMGGRIAIETALTAPDRVDKLALLAPSMAFRKFRQAAPVVRFLSPEMGVLPVPVLSPYIHRGIRLLFARPERLSDAWYDAAVDEFLRVFRTPRGRVALFAAARQIYLERPFGPRGFWPRLATLRHETLFLWGDRDRMVPAGFARHVEETLPNARSIVMESTGHVPQFEHPERTHALVREFLGG
ncbi:MAG TPA: alpha/beta fold hydrolase [Polyangiaceae bacterium]|nr:alpha/beta fold hydrolase [Polyangiaceae bacterium]